MSRGACCLALALAALASCKSAPFRGVSGSGDRDTIIVYDEACTEAEVMAEGAFLKFSFGRSTEYPANALTIKPASPAAIDWIVVTTPDGSDSTSCAVGDGNGLECCVGSYKLENGGTLMLDLEPAVPAKLEFRIE
jgi:hypothetical protein